MKKIKIMKSCPRCTYVKVLRDFHNNRRTKDKKCYNCKFCRNKERQYYHKKSGKEAARRYKQLLRYNNRKKMIEYLQARGCADCGNKNPIVLDFHHLKNKYKNISALLAQGAFWDRILQEAKKCIIVCANCHRIRHAKEDKTWRYTFLNNK